MENNSHLDSNEDNSDSESEALIDAGSDLLRYGVSALWAAATQSIPRSDVRPQNGLLSTTWLSGAAGVELSRRLRIPTPQCPYAGGHVAPEVARVWAVELFEFIDKDDLSCTVFVPSESRGGLKHRLRTTVWVMGNVAVALKSLQQGHTVGRSSGDRPLPSYSYQHSIVRSRAANGYSLLLHPDNMLVGGGLVAFQC
jgi:hypothetical protein